ncbi:MAG: hypothetical protein AAFN44_07695 [Pseudomonadota bacterium]
MAKKRNRLIAAAQAKQDNGKEANSELDRIRAQVLKGPEEPTKRLNLQIPVSLHTAFKLQATKDGRSMSDIAMELIQGYLNK